MRIFQTSLATTGITLLVMAMGCQGPGNNKPPGMKVANSAAQVPPPPPIDKIPLDPALLADARAELSVDAKSSDPVLRAHTIEAMQDVGQPPERDQVILAGLTDTSALVRYSAAMASGQARIEAARGTLLEMTQDKSPLVQIGVIFALHRLGDHRLSHELEAFATDPDEHIRGATAVALGLLGEPSALRPLAGMLNDRSASVRLQVVEAQWRLGDEDALNTLVTATISNHPDDQAIALLALAGPRDQQVSEHVYSALSTEYFETQLVAARAMGWLGSDAGYSVAIKGATSKDPRHRHLAALAFGAIGRSDTQKYLKTLLKDSEPEVRIAAARAELSLKAPN